MKKIFPLLVLVLFAAATPARSQVSAAFYDHFKNTVKENAGKGYFTAITNACKACFNLGSDTFYTEIKSLSAKGTSDSAAIKMIEKETITTFIDQDYEAIFCPERARVGILELYSAHFCDQFTPQYEKIAPADRYKSVGNLMTESMSAVVKDPVFLQNLNEQMQGLSAADGKKLKDQLVPYINFHCPVLKAELYDIPRLSGARHDLASFLRDQRWNISNAFKKAIATPDIDTLEAIFLTQEGFQRFRQMYGSAKAAYSRYQQGDKKDYVEWKPSSIVQTFAQVKDGNQFTILFQLTYVYKQVATRLLVEKVIYTPYAEIKDKKALSAIFRDKLEAPPPPLPE